MNNILNDLPDEVLEEIVYEYEDDCGEIDVDKIIEDLKSNISDFLYDNPDDFIPEFPDDKIDFDFIEDKIPDEYFEKIEPKDEICG